MSWHPDGQRLAAANRSNRLRIYPLAAGQAGEPAVLKGANPLAGFNDVAFSGDGARLATGSTMTLGQIWDPAAGQPLLTVHHIFTRQNTTVHVWTEVHGVAFSPDGTRLVTASSDHTARIWDAASGARLAELSHDGAILTVACGPDGDLIATGGYDKAARIWQAASGQSVHLLRHGGLVQKVAFSPDGATVATASADKTARIWDVGTGEQQAEFRHDGGVRSVAFSPDGRWLATGSADQNARICDLRTGQRPLELRHNSAVNAVAFSPDGSRLAAAGGNTVVIWNVADLS
jgi:WD40 repeat protein